MEHVQYMPKEAKKEQEQLRLLKTVLFGYNCLIFVSLFIIFIIYSIYNVINIYQVVGHCVLPAPVVCR